MTVDDLTTEERNQLKAAVVSRIAFLNSFLFEIGRLDSRQALRQACDDLVKAAQKLGI